MIKTEGMVKTIDDKLKVCWWDKKTGRVLCQRKRTSYTSAIVKEIQAVYLTGTIPVVKLIRETYNLSLRDSLNVLNYLRTGTPSFYYGASYLKNFY